jgi:hypothetical protein
VCKYNVSGRNTHGRLATDGVAVPKLAHDDEDDDEMEDEEDKDDRKPSE